MLGSIAGDIIGSVYEDAGLKTRDFPLFGEHSTFTDDTVLTVATGAALLGDGDFGKHYRDFTRRYPDAGYGCRFMTWVLSPKVEMGGRLGERRGHARGARRMGRGIARGSARTSRPKRSSDPLAPCGYSGRPAVAAAVFMARRGATKKSMVHEIGSRFGYDLRRRLEAVRPTYGFAVEADASVPEALIAFLEAEDYESTVRNAISLGGDADTQAAIAGGVAEAFWGAVPQAIVEPVRARLPVEFLEIIDCFEALFPAD